VFGEMTGDESFTIKNIYYHIWWKSANEIADIGVEVHGLYDSSMDFSFSTSHSKAVSTVEKNGYWLTTYLQEVSYVEEDIHNMAVKVASIDAIPSVYSGVDQYSFIILNLDDDEILKANDKDNDGLSDHDELFTYFTNPDDGDTDNDGLNDHEEVVEGSDGYLTDPNDFDMDIDDLLDGDDPNPLNTQYRIIDEEWLVEGDEFVDDQGLLVKSDIRVKAGGSLTLENIVLKMNQEGEQNKIRVDPGGELTIKNSKLVTDDPDHWYSRTLQTEHWHNERTFEIFGTAVIQNNVIDYGSMIYVRASNDTIIEGNEITHYYYGIFCSYASPKIYDNTILPFIGNGIFLWYSSSDISNSVIRTYIGTGISCYYSSPIIRDCEISGGSNDFYLAGDSHPIVSNTNFNNSMVHIDDSSSSLLVGSFESNHQEDDDNDIESGNIDAYYSGIGLSALIILTIILTYFRFSKIFVNFKRDDKLYSVGKNLKKGGKNRRRGNSKGRNSRRRGKSRRGRRYKKNSKMR
jgi:parallel beta-helix repeat protein